jgi:alpha-L-arabinofuranosidase
LLKNIIFINAKLLAENILPYFSLTQYLFCMKKIIFCQLLMLITVAASAQLSATLVVNPSTQHDIIHKEIYGMFSEHLGRDIYDGIYVGDTSSIPNKDGIRLDVVKALKDIDLPVLRWPGGCFADDYHWMDGIGPKDKRPSTTNTTWGNVQETDAFGTAEFLELCKMIGCEPYIAGNVGSGTVKEMSQWVEYLNSNQPSSITELRKQNGQDSAWGVSFWGVGNESWGCGGNMTPEYYSDQFRRYASFLKNYPGTPPLKKIASGPNGNDKHWMEVLMKNIPHNMMWGVSLHYYTIATGNWGNKGSATDFGEDQYFGAMERGINMRNVINDQEAVMDQYDPQKKIALVVDEWGIWTNVEPGTNPAFLYQQNSLRDALLAASTLNIFNNHCDRVKMANLAQTVNVLQSVILTKGAQMILTPTYYVFDLYKVHQDATLLPTQMISPDYSYDDKTIPAVNVSASQDSSGVVHISLVNIDPTKYVEVHTALNNISANNISGEILTADHFNDYNSFNDPNKIKPATFNNFKKDNNGLDIKLPPMSVVMVTVK